MWKLVPSKGFEKSFSKIPHTQQILIRKKLCLLSQIDNPNKLNISTQVACGNPTKFRLKVGNYRVFYDLDWSSKEILLWKISLRNEKTYKGG